MIASSSTILAVCGSHQWMAAVYKGWEAVAHIAPLGEQPVRIVEEADGVGRAPVPRIGEVGVFGFRPERSDPILVGMPDPMLFPEWHYDQVDAALCDGRIAMAAAWPGATAAIRASRHASCLAPHPYPAGPCGRFTYAGAHAWAIPTTCADVGHAVALLHRLAGAAAARLELATGGVPAHVATFAAAQPLDATDARRLALTRDAIATQMITYPPHPSFPALEDAGWQALRDALLGRASPAAAVDRLQRHAQDVFAP